MKVLSLLLVVLLSFTFFISCNTGPLISKGEIFKNLTQITSNDSHNFSPAVSFDGKKLLFVSDRDGNNDIYLKNNIVSKSVIKKTSHQSSDINPCFSPDAVKFCFASNRNGNYDIFIMNVERGFAKTQITTSYNDEILPNWSPNGDLIAFSQFSNTDKEWYIWTKNLETGQLTQICRGLYPIFSKDSKKIFYKKSGKKYYELWEIDIDGENDTQLISSSKWGIGSYTISPDGKNILYSTLKGFFSNKFNINKESDGLDLWVLNLENGNQIQITTHKGSDFDPAWSSTGDIYFASTRMSKFGKTNIWSFKLNL